MADDIYPGFDWYCVAEDMGQLTPDPRYRQACDLQKTRYYDVAEFPTSIPGDVMNAGLRDRVRAQIHNDATGWDRPENVAAALAEPKQISQIYGNFSRRELTPSQGYALPVGIGHAGDYVGYTVSYREYMSRDSYRKALTSYGPHTADYMVSRLVKMAAAMNGGPELTPEPHDVMAQLDELRQETQSRALGAATAAAYDAWLAAVPLDVGPAMIIEEPNETPLFSAATVSWRGGNTQIDNPLVHIEYCELPVLGSCMAWSPVADMTGEIQTRVAWPRGLPGVVATYLGQFEWVWTANFEAYRAFPSSLPSVSEGMYRFHISGCINDGMSDPATHLAGRVSQAALAVTPDVVDAAIGRLVARPCVAGAIPYAFNSMPFDVVDGQPAATYTSTFPFISTELGRNNVCKACSFRPWARPDGAY